MTPTARILTLAALLAGCAPALRFPGDWDASPDASEARTDASRADATDSARDARSDAGDARVDRAEVLSVDVPGADVVVFADSAVVWIADAPDASDAGVVDAPVVADVPAVDVQAPVDAPSAPDVLPPCGVLEARCGGACVPLLTTAAHCGACGRACPSPAGGVGVCNGGRCEVACAEGYADCGRGCQSVESDRENCGRCGSVCGTRETCVAGNCAGCATGESVCGGRCMDLSEDAANCGSCGNVCPVGMACIRGSGCGWVSCDGGTRRDAGLRAIWTRCPDGCFDFENDDHHCGSCVRSCPSGQHCGGGFCR